MLARRASLTLGMLAAASLVGSAFIVAQPAPEALRSQLAAEQTQAAKEAMNPDFWLDVFRWFGKNPWAWELVVAFLIYQLLGGALLAVFQIKFGDRRERKDMSVGFLLLWEFLAKTCFDVVGLIRAILSAFLPNWVQRIPFVAAMLGLGPKTQAASLGLGEPER